MRLIATVFLSFITNVMASDSRDGFQVGGPPTPKGLLPKIAPQANAKTQNMGNANMSNQPVCSNVLPPTVLCKQPSILDFFPLELDSPTKKQ